MANYTVWCTRWDTGELANTSVFQPLKFNKNVVLRAIRTRIVVVDNPTFTDLNMKIYSDRGGSPQTLLATSTNVITKAALHTLDNGVKETFFRFGDPAFEADTQYHVVINGTGYAPTATAMLGWQKDFPEQIYTPSALRNPTKLGVHGHGLGIIASQII